VVFVLLLLGACSSDTKPSPAASSSSSSAPRVLQILVSNDDGVASEGIDALVQALVAEQDVAVTVVAPAENQSGTGGKTSPAPVTAHDAVTISGHRAVAVDGFPADAVLYGLTTVLHEPPDLVITGTNAGQNIGPFIDISGTVGAARAAAQRGVPALAVSAGLADEIDFQTASQLAVEWLRGHRGALVAGGPPPTTLSNLNAPSCTIGHVRGIAEVTPDPSVPAEQALASSDCTSTIVQPPTDVAAFLDGFATLSQLPLRPAGG